MAARPATPLPAPPPYTNPASGFQFRIDEAR
jgi:hypothetical protein